MTAVIRGPKEKALFRDDPVAWHGYVDPLPSCDIADASDQHYPSVSEIKKAWPKFLGTWIAGEAAAAAYKFRDVLPRMDEAEVRDLISTASDRSRDAAAARGHEIHDLLEHLLDGGNFGGLLEINAATEYLDCLQLIAEKERPVVVASEVVTFASPKIGRTVYRHAGTFDAIWHIEGHPSLTDGNYMVDYKSRKRGKAATRYPEEGCQLAAYTGADYWVVEDDDGIRRMRPLDIVGGLIVSIAPDGYKLYPVDLTIARKHWLRTVEFHNTLAEARTMFGKPLGHKVPEIEGGGAVKLHDLGGRSWDSERAEAIAEIEDGGAAPVDGSTPVPVTSTDVGTFGEAITEGADESIYATDPGESTDREVVAVPSIADSTSPGSSIASGWNLDDCRAGRHCTTVDEVCSLDRRNDDHHSVCCGCREPLDSTPTTNMDELVHEARTQWILERIDAIKDAGHVATLGTLWPRDIAALPERIRNGETTWTDVDFGYIVDALNAAEAKHQLSFGDPDPLEVWNQAKAREAAANVQQTPARPPLPEVDDDGSIAPHDDVAGLRTLLAAVVNDKATAHPARRIAMWVKEGEIAQRPWAMSKAGVPTLARKHAICAAALELVALIDEDSDSPEWGVRAAIASVIGEDLQPTWTTGGVLGSLTTAQANGLADIARTHLVATSDAGTPQLVAAA